MSSVVAPLVVAGVAVLGGCASASDESEPSISAVGESAVDQFPEILGVEATPAAADTWNFAVTISSPYDSPTRYADGWRVIGPDGTVYGIHTLTHDHASEQPFTRRQTGVTIPDDVDQVTIEGRDLVNGFGGPTRTIDLDRNS